MLFAALTPLLYLPAWVVALGAAAARKWRLLVASLLIVALHVWWTAPVFIGGRGALRGASVSAKVLALNLNADRATGAATARLVKLDDPDLVVLSEASPVSTAGLDLTNYPVKVSDIESGTNGWLVASKWPLLNQRRVGIGDRELPRLEFRRPDGGRLVLWQVHPIAPILGQVGKWRRELVAIRRAVRADERGSDRAVIAGDFNATRDIPEFRAFLGDGWADAADGRGLFATWRAGGKLPPLLRLDHILLSPGIGVAWIRRTPDVGSDHLGIVARLEFPR
ncbi:MAG: endonuclease/exonuclease/phosphatase family protein [Frankiaceae bacterium]|nr:endonuclease/exonuclease/phosphatase family protein [Frankiaceae bacterium]